MKHLLKHFTRLSLHPKNASELKGLILQLAVEGKLTANWRLENLEIEPASVLLERIKVKKAQLVDSKKLKKEKLLNNISSEEIPFSIPKGWEWSRLGYVVNIIRGITFPSSEKFKEDENGRVPCLRTANVQEKIEWDDILYINSKFVKRNEQYIEKGDIIMSMANSRELVGKVAIISQEPQREITLGGFLSSLRTYEIEPYFLMSLLRTPYARIGLISSSSQTTNIANVSIGRLRPFLIPIPPLVEQKAIVEVVNQLFTEVEQLETLAKKRIQLKEDFVTSALQQLSTGDTASEWSFLQEHFATFFTEQSNVKKLRESILQLAVQGELTKHWRKENPDVEDASVLLERIKEEKAQLVKEKKIKKEKPLLEITEEEIPYDLPEGWVWCRLGNYVLCERGRFSARPRNDPQYYDGQYPFIQIGDLDKNGGLITKHRQSLNEQGLRVSKLFPKGTITIAIVGATIGRTGILGYEMCFPDSLVGIKPSEKYNSNYLEYYLRSKEMEFRMISYAGGGQPNIKLPTLKEAVFPLAPIQEQKAIIKKVNILMSLCDQLEQEIRTNKATQEDWMKSSLREVFETEPVPLS